MQRESPTAHHPIRDILGAFLAIALCITVLRQPEVVAAPLSVIALSHHPPPGTVEADSFVRFDEPPAINNRGQVAFLAGPAAAAGTPFTAATSVWLGDRKGPPDLLARRDGTTVLAEAEFQALVLNNRGDVAIRATQPGSDAAIGQQVRLWLHADDALHAIASTGHRATGLDDDAQFVAFDGQHALNDFGQLAFYARTVADGPSGIVQGSGLWMADRQQTHLAAASGSVAVPGPTDDRFLAQSFEPPFGEIAVIDPRGRATFRGFVAGGGVTPQNRNGLWAYESGGNLQLLARGGQVVGGTDGLPLISFPSVPARNAAGTLAAVAFFGDLDAGGDPVRGDTLPETPRAGLWVGGPGALEPTLLLGEVAAGTGGEGRFRDIFQPVLNAHNRIATMAVIGGANVDTSNELGIWSDGFTTRGELSLIAREGDAAAGVGPNGVFNFFLNPSMNARGQVAFLAGLAGPGISTDAGNVVGLWAQDPHGELQLIVREGQNIHLGPGDTRAVAAIAFASESGGEDGRPRGFNDRGQLAFRVRFTDGSSAVMLSHRVAVPEPTASTLLIVLIAGVAGCLPGATRARAPQLKASFLTADRRK